MPTRAVIVGTGYAVPPKVVTNHDIAKLVDTSDEWIVQRTGISERRVTTEEETAATLGAQAALEALAKANLGPDEIDLIVVGTVTGDYIFPSTSCLIQDKIGAHRAGAFDVGAACAGFIYSLATAAAMIESNQIRRALVIGVDVLTKFVDWTDRSTCVLFGDGAGAVVLESQEGTNRGVVRTVLLSDGSGARHINLAAGLGRHPMSRDSSKDVSCHIFMAGAEVYRFAVHAMGDACCRLLDEMNYSSTDIDLFVPHQANLRIIKSAAERLGLPDHKVFVNVHKYGNTSGGSIPLALCEAEREGVLKPGMLVMTVGFGAGLVWGANLIRW